MRVYLVLIALFFLTTTTGCGPAIVVLSAIAGQNMENRCSKIDAKAEKDHLTDRETRRLLIKSDCRTYVKNYM